MKAFLPDQTFVSQVQVRTARLGRLRQFYSEILGLQVSREWESGVAFSGNPNRADLLILSEASTAPPRPARSVGLHHFALRYATRNALALGYRRLTQFGYRIAGAADHGVSEAIYLRDPDGNGIELYADRPRLQWTWRDGQIAMVNLPLDLDNLLAAEVSQAAMTAPLPLPELGHLHLQVADLDAAERFYREFLGLAVSQRSYPGSLFFAAGAYHHHIAVNVCAGNPAPADDSEGLVSYRLEVPVAEILYCLKHRAPLLGYQTRMEPAAAENPVFQVRDPNGTWLQVQASPAAARTDSRSPWTGKKSQTLPEIMQQVGRGETA